MPHHLHIAMTGSIVTQVKGFALGMPAVNNYKRGVRAQGCNNICALGVMLKQCG